MSDLRKIQQIYEGGYNGVSIDTPLSNYTQSNVGRTSKAYTYQRPIPTTSPDKPAYVQAPLGTSPIESEEEVIGNIPRSDVVKLLNQEMENAVAENMDYCVYVLGKLIKAVKGN